MVHHEARVGNLTVKGTCSRSPRRRRHLGLGFSQLLPAEEAPPSNIPGQTDNRTSLRILTVIECCLTICISMLPFGVLWHLKTGRLVEVIVLSIPGGIGRSEDQYTVQLVRSAQGTVYSQL